MYNMFKQGISLKCVTLCMGDTAVNVASLKKTSKEVFLVMQMTKTRGVWVFAVLQEPKYKMTCIRLNFCCNSAVFQALQKPLRSTTGFNITSFRIKFSTWFHLYYFKRAMLVQVCNEQPFAVRQCEEIL